MGPVQNDSQYKQLPTLVIPSSIGNKMGRFNSSAPSPVTQSRPAQISPGNRSVTSPGFGPLTSGYVQAPQFLRGQTGPITGGGYGHSVPWNPMTDQSLFPPAGGVTGPQFANQNTDTSYGGQQDIYRGGKVNFGAGGVTGAGVSAGGGVGAADNTHPEEKRWKILAEKYGVNWDVTKNIYMRSPRNPGFDPAVALNLQLDDKAFGDAAMRAGVLTGNADYDRNVWDDWYNANGNIERSPLAGHNYAIMDYEANQARAKQMVNGTPQPPEWL
jgi:hypothetical protein